MIIKNNDKNPLSHAGEELIIGNFKFTREPEFAREPEFEPFTREDLANMFLKKLRERVILIN